MKHLTLIILLALSVSASSLPFSALQDPQDPISKPIFGPNGEVISIELPSGTIIPFGQYELCTEECFSIETQDHSRKKWLIALPIAGAIIVGLIPKGDTSILTPPTPTSTPTTPVVPVTPVPESSSWELLLCGLVLYFSFSRSHRFMIRRWKGWRTILP